MALTNKLTAIGDGVRRILNNAQNPMLLDQMANELMNYGPYGHFKIHWTVVPFDNTNTLINVQPYLPPEEAAQHPEIRTDYIGTIPSDPPFGGEWIQFGFEINLEEAMEKYIDSQNIQHYYDYRTIKYINFAYSSDRSTTTRYYSIRLNWNENGTLNSYHVYNGANSMYLEGDENSPSAPAAQLDKVKVWIDNVNGVKFLRVAFVNVADWGTGLSGAYRIMYIREEFN